MKKALPWIVLATVLLATVAGFLLCAWVYRDGNHFVLFNGTFEDIEVDPSTRPASAATKTNRLLLRLDTRNGRVWRWQEMTIGTNLFTGWTELQTTAGGRAVSRPSE